MRSATFRCVACALVGWAGGALSMVPEIRSVYYPHLIAGAVLSFLIPLSGHIVAKEIK